MLHFASLKSGIAWVICCAIFGACVCFFAIFHNLHTRSIHTGCCTIVVFCHCTACPVSAIRMCTETQTPAFVFSCAVWTHGAPSFRKGPKRQRSRLTLTGFPVSSGVSSSQVLLGFTSAVGTQILLFDTCTRSSGGLPGRVVQFHFRGSRLVRYEGHGRAAHFLQ